MNMDAHLSDADQIDEKSRLILKNRLLHSELESDLENMKGKVLHYGKYALLGGAVFIATYYVMGTIFSKEEKKEKVREKIIYVSAPGEETTLVSSREPFYSPIVRSAMTSIANFLVSIAKQKLLEYLENLTENEAKKDLQPTA